MAFGGAVHAANDERHAHPAPEQLGRVTFATTCAPVPSALFERALALLHSFARAKKKAGRSPPRGNRRLPGQL
jgi:hypothetical protein